MLIILHTFFFFNTLSGSFPRVTVPLTSDGERETGQILKMAIFDY